MSKDELQDEDIGENEVADRPKIEDGDIGETEVDELTETEEESDENEPRKNDKMKRVVLFVVNGLLSLVIVMLIAILVLEFLFQPCYVDGESMTPTISDTQIIIIKKGQECQRGDIIVLRDVSEKGNIVKRAIGLGGDRIVFKIDPADDKHVLLLRDTGNGFETLDESSYIKEPMDVDYFYPGSCAPKGTDGDELARYALVVPQGEVFFLGDNRNNSADSRYYGTQPVSKIVGKRAANIEGTLIEKVLVMLCRDDQVKNGSKNGGKNRVAYKEETKTRYCVDIG